MWVNCPAHRTGCGSTLQHTPLGVGQLSSTPHWVWVNSPAHLTWCGSTLQHTPLGVCQLSSTPHWVWVNSPAHPTGCGSTLQHSACANIVLHRSVVPIPTEYTSLVSPTSVQRSRSVRVLKMLTLHGRTDGHLTGFTSHLGRDDYNRLWGVKTTEMPTRLSQLHTDRHTHPHTQTLYLL